MKSIPLVTNDAGLEPFAKIIRRRAELAAIKAAELSAGKSFKNAGNAHLYYGLHRLPEGWTLREKAPSAYEVYIIGDFSEWKPLEKYRMTRLDNGDWEIQLPLDALNHLSLYKLFMRWRDGSGERIPAYCRRVVQDEATKIFSAQVWNPPKAFAPRHKRPIPPNNPMIYEAHIGMSSEEEKVSTFAEFRRNVLPRIANAGYNVLQLMALQEHPYYGSFGYQVSNFFAVSSRFGTPDELKELIDEAHRLGICTVMDIVHSHAVKNESEGLSRFDGSYDLYFHAGERGDHALWNSRCFDYGKTETLSFLLSNCKYWLEEYGLDGFRFDGVTSMMYRDHGLGRDFNGYDAYFDSNADEDAMIYLMLANRLIHELKADAITIAEDVSGMPGLAAPAEYGGFGFDFRMAMGIADFWIKTIKEKTDEQWSVGDMFYELTNKRADERTISYAECHDQAMVGDQTIIFRLADKEMYDSMDVFRHNIIIDRAVALHKMIRLLSASTAGDGYLNFMGNEFGHPEWIDFPREGNGWSHHYARRQWSLRDDTDLRYRFLAEFDRDMIALIKSRDIFSHRPFAIVQNVADQVLVFKRGATVFLFNFNPVKSFTDYGFRIDAGKYTALLDTDAKIYDGFGRIDSATEYFTSEQMNENWIKVYLPARSALVLALDC
ncbi:MAG: alpha amylase C-terminal domain-containing protein [Prevotellaceae bacterium]|jgi:1,4-alpha-glucan branching enzyme|nr:alpha amylase C-terminal domain-containing protein [Prevotellaceae bacterium]